MVVDNYGLKGSLLPFLCPSRKELLTFGFLTIMTPFKCCAWAETQNDGGFVAFQNFTLSFPPMFHFCIMLLVVPHVFNCGPCFQWYSAFTPWNHTLWISLLLSHALKLDDVVCLIDTKIFDMSFFLSSSSTVGIQRKFSFYC